MENEKPSVTQPQAGAAEESETGSQGKETLADRRVEGGADFTAPELPSDLAAAYQELREEKDALYERLLRKQAELENFRKRVQREKEEFHQHATADLVRALLPTLDGFDWALKHRDAAVPAQFYQGIELIYQELLEVLKRAGLSPLETVGKTFDPHLHQAVETVPASQHRDQEIVEELQRGYKLKHRLLRPAIVKVAVAPRTESAQLSSGQSVPPEDAE